MRVLSFYRASAAPGGAPTPEHMEKMGAFMTEMTQKGHLVAAGGFPGEVPGIHAKLSNGKYTVLDIPDPAQGFGGFGYMQAASREEMDEIVRRFMEVAGDGECVMWPCMDGLPQPEQDGRPA